MSKEFEKIITKKLYKNNLDEIYRHFINQIKFDDTLKEEEQIEILTFLANASQWDSLRTILIDSLKKTQSGAFICFTLIAWIEGCQNKEIKKNNEFKNDLLTNYSDFMKSYLILVRFFSPSPLDIEFKNLCKDLEKKIFSQKKKMIETIEYMKNQRVLEGEKKAIAQYLKAFPKDEKYNQVQADFNEKWARKIIEKHKKKTYFFSPPTQPLPFFLFEELKKKKNTNRDLSHDLVILCVSIEAYDEALILCESLDLKQTNSCWLFFEVALQAKKYVLALDLLTQIELQLSHQAELSMAIIYNKALILKGLNYRVAALELLETIAQVDPNYRSTSTLLTTWRKESVDE